MNDMVTMNYQHDTWQVELTCINMYCNVVAVLVVASGISVWVAALPSSTLAETEPARATVSLRIIFVIIKLDTCLIGH